MSCVSRACSFAAIVFAALLLASPLSSQIRRVRGARGTPQGVNTGSALPAADFDGTLLKLDGKEILLSVEEGRMLEIRRSGKTRFFKGPAPIKPAEFKRGDHVSVEATRDVDSSLLAVNVYLGDAPGAKKTKKDESASSAYSPEVPPDEDERLKQQKDQIRAGEKDGAQSAGSRGGEQKWQAPADEDKKLDEQKPGLTPAERKLLRRTPPPAATDRTPDQKP